MQYDIQIEVNTLRPRQNGRHFPDIFNWIFLNENVWISINISLKFVPRGPVNNIPTLVQVMAWRRPGDKPLSEPMIVYSMTHICVTRPQWVNDNVITATSTMKILSIHIDSKLNFNGHIAFLCTKSGRQLNISQCMRGSLDYVSRMAGYSQQFHYFKLQSLPCCLDVHQ